MDFPKSVEKSEEVKSRLLQAIVKSNILLAEYAKKYNVNITDLRDIIFGRIGVISADIVTSIDKNDLNIIQDNQKKIHSFLECYYDIIADMAYKTKMDSGEIYLLAYGKMWYYTDLSVPVMNYLYSNVLRRSHVGKLPNAQITIRNSRISRLVKEYVRKSIELAHKNHRRPTQEEVMDCLQWGDDVIKKFLLLPLNQMPLDISYVNQIPSPKDVKNIDCEILNGLSDIEKDSILAYINGEPMRTLCSKHKCERRTLNYALKRAQSKLNFAAKRQEIA